MPVIQPSMFLMTDVDTAHRNQMLLKFRCDLGMGMEAMKTADPCGCRSVVELATNQLMDFKLERA